MYCVLLGPDSCKLSTSFHTGALNNLQVHTLLINMVLLHTPSCGILYICTMYQCNDSTKAFMMLLRLSFKQNWQIISVLVELENFKSRSKKMSLIRFTWLHGHMDFRRKSCHVNILPFLVRLIKTIQQWQTWKCVSYIFLGWGLFNPKMTKKM